MSNFKQMFTLVEMLVVIAIIGILAALLMPSLRSAVDTAKAVTCQNNFKQIALSIHLFADDNRNRCVGEAHSILGSGGYVPWETILKATVLPEGMSIARFWGSGSNILGCPNNEYLKPFGSRRGVALNAFLILYNRMEVTDLAQWPGGPYSTKPSGGYYRLGTPLTAIRSPSKVFLATDMDGHSGDGFNWSSLAYGPNTLLTPSSFTDAYNKVGSISFRHGMGTLCSMLYVDSHVKLITAEPENFTRESIVLP